jgi:predicted DCC family thiol-disulfide oxidoreductase YuxK
MNPGVTSAQFGAFRILFGLYLFLHFWGLLPHSAELFSHVGMLPDPQALPSWKVPNLFWLGDSPARVQGVLLGGMVASFLLILGIQRRWVGLLLWAIWMSLFNRNFLISNPSIPYVGLLLLMMAALPRGERLSLGIIMPKWQMPPAATRGFFFLLMAGYTVSGIHKLGSPSWVDGTALSHVLQLPLARTHMLADGVRNLPDWLMMSMTWGALALELLALPLTLLPQSRKWIWLALLSMQIGILTLVDFADLTWAMIVAHLFVFHKDWLMPVPFNTPKPIVFFDGVCGLCNRAVDFILAEDGESQFQFAPTQGATAQALGREEVAQGKSMALQDGDTVYTRSDAVLRIAAGLGGFWRVLSWLSVVPRPLRDMIYEGVQMNRYRMFGKKESCRLPSPGERTRFLP